MDGAVSVASADSVTKEVPALVTSPRRQSLPAEEAEVGEHGNAHTTNTTDAQLSVAELIEPDAGSDESDENNDKIDAADAPSAVDLLSLPTTAIARLAKAKLPDNMSISKDGKALLVRATSTFILYLTAA